MSLSSLVGLYDDTKVGLYDDTKEASSLV